MSEAFIYLWYDAPNDMYYLGKHKGSPHDTYTHSSTVWEHFTKNNIPEGVTKEILAYGTDEEMCILEHELLVEAKNSGNWNRYYNKTVYSIGSEIIHDFIPEEGRILQPNGQFSYQKYHKLLRQADLKKHREQERKRRKRKKYRDLYGTDNFEIVHGRGTLEDFLK